MQAGRVLVRGKALRYLTGVWLISSDDFVEALRDHLAAGGRFYRKFKKDSPELLPHRVEASIWLREPDADDDFDDGTVYLELILKDEALILVVDAHEHEAGMLRLPRFL